MFDYAMELDRFLRLYPHLFVQKIGLECGTGWFGLQDELFASLEHQIIEGIQLGRWQCLSNEADRQVAWPFATQIKEKFGGLRVYMSQRSTEMNKSIDFAVNRARVTCDVCGEPGTFRDTTGWLRTRCDYHANSNLSKP